VEDISMSRICFNQSLSLLLLVIPAMGRSEVNAQTAPSSAAAPAGTNREDPSVAAGSEAPGEKTQARKEKKNQGDAKSEEKTGEWVAAPIPINSPALGAGLEFVVARVFPLNKNDKVSPPSAVAVGGLITNNGSRALGVGSRLYFKENHYRVTAALGTFSLNADLYGVGREAGHRGIFVPLNVDGRGLLSEFLFRIKKDMYIGVKGQYRNLSLSLDREELDSPDRPSHPPDRIKNVIDELSPHLLDQQTVSLGPRFEWDSRDNVFYPTVGVFMDAYADLFGTGLGSKWTYQAYRVGLNKYGKLGEHQVLALRGLGCAAAGDHVPIYDLCLFGAQNDLRGYAAGRFQDRRMFAAQAEYRLMFPSKGFLGRFGVVAFGGAGWVGDKFSDIGFSDLLPSGGGGVRFRLTKKDPINFRVDYGFGRVGNTLSIGVLEAF